MGILGTLAMLYEVGKYVKDVADDVTGGPIRAREEMEKTLDRIYREKGMLGEAAQQDIYLKELQGMVKGTRDANLFSRLSSGAHENVLDELVRGHELELASMAHREPPSLLNMMRPVGLF